MTTPAEQHGTGMAQTQIPLPPPQQQLLREDRHWRTECGRSLQQPIWCAEVRSSSQEADSQYIEEGSLNKRMFSDLTFQNSFLSFPASWWCFFHLGESFCFISPSCWLPLYNPWHRSDVNVKPKGARVDGNSVLSTNSSITLSPCWRGTRWRGHSQAAFSSTSAATIGGFFSWMNIV